MSILKSLFVKMRINLFLLESSVTVTKREILSGEYGTRASGDSRAISVFRARGGA